MATSTSLIDKFWAASILICSLLKIGTGAGGWANWHSCFSVEQISLFDILSIPKFLIACSKLLFIYAPSQIPFGIDSELSTELFTMSESLLSESISTSLISLKPAWFGGNIKVCYICSRLFHLSLFQINLYLFPIFNEYNSIA